MSQIRNVALVHGGFVDGSGRMGAIAAGAGGRSVGFRGKQLDTVVGARRAWALGPGPSP
jgi:hypothetical protein